MKNKIIIIASTLFLLVATSFAQVKKATWPQMKTFHSYMAATFHPAEEGNFVPLKQKADSLLITAKLWMASPIPNNFKPAETKAALENLINQCATIKTAVTENASNDKLKKLITEAHEIFHKIIGECQKADE